MEAKREANKRHKKIENFHSNICITMIYKYYCISWIVCNYKGDFGCRYGIALRTIWVALELVEEDVFSLKTHPSIKSNAPQRLG